MALSQHSRSSRRPTSDPGAGFAVRRLLAAVVVAGFAAVVWALAGPGLASAEPATPTPGYQDLVARNHQLERELRAAAAAVGGTGSLSARLDAVSRTLGGDLDRSLLARAQGTVARSQARAERITHHKAQKQDLRARLVAVAARVSELDADARVRAAQLDDAHASVERLGRTISARDLTIETLAGDKAGLQDSLSAANGEVEALTAQVADQASTIEGLAGDKAGLQASLSAANAKVESLTTAKADLEHSLSAANGKVEALTAQVAAQASTIEGLAGDKAGLQASLSAANAKVETLTAAKAELEHSVAAAEATAEGLTAQVSNATGTLRSIPGITQATDLAGVAANAKTLVNNRDVTIGNLSAQITTFNSTISDSLNTVNYLSRFMKRGAAQPNNLPEALVVLRGILGA
jgi:chromosome segregation ATPase